jgi:hypothetical protein
MEEPTKFFQVVSRIKTPLVLSGVVVVALYGIYKTVLALDVFEKVGGESTYRLLDSVLSKIFWLAMVSIVLGVGSYLVTMYWQKSKTEPNPALAYGRDPRLRDLIRLTETLREKRQDDGKTKAEKWQQVAKHMDEIADLLDGAIKKYKRKVIPFRDYGELEAIRDQFIEVVTEVMGDDRGVGDSFRPISRALHLMQEGDEGVVEFINAAAEGRTNDRWKAVIKDLEITSGQIRGLAKSFKARG